MLKLCTARGKCLLAEAERLGQRQPTLAGFGVAISLADAIAQLVEAKRRKNLKPIYLKSLAYYLGRFASGREQGRLTSSRRGTWRTSSTSSPRRPRARRG